ncbi:MAG: PHB depolymerase family esterase [Deltaproteobacteria bacterium]|nr:PHB depolymerase family esterase [Deltaproteobacteria bacterium]
MSFIRQLIPVVLVSAACGSELVSPEEVAASSSELTSVSGFGSNPGGLVMRVHVPRDVFEGAALVVALHGCTQSANDYVSAGWNDLANLEKFYVLYPEQQRANNQSLCFNWFEPGDVSRSQGEALSIKQMVDTMKSRYDIDDSRVYVTGLSAGAAMTSALLAAYPDVFVAGAIMAGIPAGCASSMVDAFSCMNPGRDLTPAAWAERARRGHSTWNGALPRVSIWHGTADHTVRDTNRAQLERQWTAMHEIPSNPTRTELVGDATHAEFADAAGQVSVESWSIPGMAHGTAIDAGFAPAGGCGAPGAYILDQGVCSTYHAWRFFEAPRGESVARPDPVAPSDPTPPAHDPTADPTDCPDQTPPAEENPNAPVSPEPSEVPSVPEGAAWVCVEVYDSNYEHVVSGRASRCGIGGSYVCAYGSGERLGLWTMMPTWVAETAEGYFRGGRCEL